MKWGPFFTLLAAALTVLAVVGTARAFDPTAELVLGQIDSGSDIVNLGGLTGFFNPGGVAIDPNGHVYVADFFNNRVLGWATIAGMTGGTPADLIIGQADAFSNACATTQNGLCFTSPEISVDFLSLPGQPVATDPAGNLYVADSLNERVLEFDSPFATGMTAGQPAHLVFGQGNGEPGAVALDSVGNLYVAEGGVAEYNTPLAQTAVPGSGDTTPDLVFPSCGDLNTPAADCLASARGLALDAAGNLYVADRARVLEFNTPLSKTSVPGSGDTVADVVFGQKGSFTTEICNKGSPSRGIELDPLPNAGGLCDVGGITIDSAGNLYIADTLNNRVVEYNTPLKKTKVRGSGDTIADRVFGQKSFGTSVPSDGAPTPGGNGQDPPASARGLSTPQSVAVDSVGNLYVADTLNNRVLEYNTPLQRTKAPGSGDTIADSVGGQAALTDNAINSAGPPALYEPSGVVVDGAGHLYVTDGLNDRVLGWKTAEALTNGAPADIVIGQPDAFSTACTTTRKGLCLRSHLGTGLVADAAGGGLYGAVGVDSAGNLYVADSGNNRVLEYDQPFQSGLAAGQSAHRVFGQGGSFTRKSCGGGEGRPTNNPGELCTPLGVAVDPAGNLYVADTANSRVLEYNTPLEKTKIRGSGDTVADLEFGRGLDEFLLFHPTGLAVDAAGNLWVADTSDSRVLEYNTPLEVTSTPGSGDTGADLVLGQMDSFRATEAACAGGQGNGTLAGLCYPAGVAVDSDGNVYVGDTSNSRVLEYNNPLADPSAPNTTADIVFGQGGSFTTYGCNGVLPGASVPPPPGADTLCFPPGVAADSAGNLWVADGANNRVLKFNTPVANANSQ
jgi:sugar lactone lactonase YvrE